MMFSDVSGYPYIRRRVWPLGHYATRITIGNNWYYERRISNGDRKHVSEFYDLTMALPHDDWERHEPFGGP